MTRGPDAPQVALYISEFGVAPFRPASVVPIALAGLAALILYFRDKWR